MESEQEDPVIKTEVKNRPFTCFYFFWPTICPTWLYCMTLESLHKLHFSKFLPVNQKNKTNTQQQQQKYQ